MPTSIMLAPELSSKASALRHSLGGLGALVELRPETLSVIEQGLRVQTLLDLVAPDLEIAECLTIDSPDMLAEAQIIDGRLATLAADSGAIEQERKALTAPFNDIVKAINGGYSALRQHLNAARSEHLQPKILAYNREQRRLAAEREEAERKAREEQARAIAERAAKERAESERLLAEAQKAQQSGDGAGAQVLITEASATADASAQMASEAAHVSHMRPSYTPTAKAKGVREVWTGTVTDLEEVILHVADRIRAGDHSLTALLEVDQSALGAKVKLEKAHFNVPGLRAYCGESISTRKVAVAA